MILIQGRVSRTGKFAYRLTALRGAALCQASNRLARGGTTMLTTGQGQAVGLTIGATVVLTGLFMLLTNATSASPVSWWYVGSLGLIALGTVILVAPIAHIKSRRFRRSFDALLYGGASDS